MYSSECQKLLKLSTALKPTRVSWSAYSIFYSPKWEVSLFTHHSYTEKDKKVFIKWETWRRQGSEWGRKSESWDSTFKWEDLWMWKWSDICEQECRQAKWLLQGRNYRQRWQLESE